MDYSIAFMGAILSIAITVILSLKSRARIASSLRILGIGIIITNIILLMPILNNNVVFSFLTGLQTGSLDASYAELILLSSKNIANIPIKTMYISLMYVTFAFAPVLVGGFILSFFNSALDNVLYTLQKRSRDIYYFSQLNEKSLKLAQSIHEAKKESKTKILVVFCNYDSTYFTNLIDGAKEIGAIWLSKSETELIQNNKHNTYFFEMFQNVDLNVDSTQKLLMNYKEEQKNQASGDISIYVFSDQEEAEIILNSTYKKGIKVVIVNEQISIAYNLMFNRPLYLSLQNINTKHISALVVGAGRKGKEIVKAIVWCGQLGKDYSLEIKVIDKNAQYIESALKHSCPELISSEYNIDFIKADVTTYEFENALNHWCKNTNYIVVSLGDDELNIRTSLFLRGYYLRNSPDLNNEPIINVAVESDLKNNGLTQLTTLNGEKIKQIQLKYSSIGAQNYNIFPFASHSSIFSYDYLINSPIELLSQNGHAVYENMFCPNAVRNDILNSYYVNEINKRSSRANVIHIKYKLFLLGFEMIEKTKATQQELQKASETLQMLLEMLSNEKTMETLSKLEHQRWNAYQRSEGFQGMLKEKAQLLKYSPTGSSVNLRAKLHACLCSWENLEQIEQVFGQRFRDYDISFIFSIPYILGLVQKDNINIAKVEYILKSRRENR